MDDTNSSRPLLVVAGLLRRDAKILIAQRPTGSWMEGYWEFPGGKVHAGESPREALARELEEEIGVKCAVGEIEEAIHHTYPDRTVLLLFYWCEIQEGVPKGLEGQALKWVGLDELSAEDILPADQPLIEKLTSSQSEESPNAPAQ